MTRRRKTPAEVSATRRLAAIKRHHPTKQAEPKKEERKPITPGQFKSLEGYDETMGQPRDWQDCYRREKVRGEILANEMKANDVAIARGKLFTPEQVADREREYDNLVFAQFTRLPEVMSELVEAEKKEDARKRGRAFITEIRTFIADEISRRRKS